MSITRSDVITNKDGTDAPNLTKGEIQTQISTPSAPAAGTNRIYVKSDNQIHTMSSAGVESNYMSAVSGTNGQNLIIDSNAVGGYRFTDPYYKNYVVNNDAEIGAASGWITYANTAANIPSSGTGGSPNSTWTVTTSSPLNGLDSFIWTKAGTANRQGEGVAYPFTIDAADQAQVLSIAFNYQVVSGTFTPSDAVTAPKNDGTTSTSAGNSDLEVFVYDVTNSQLIYVSPEVLVSNSTVVAGRFKGIFQTPSNSTSYRLLIHTATATTNNYVVKFDRFYCGPQQIVQGPAISDMKSYTATPSTGTFTNNVAYWRQVGDCIEVVGYSGPLTSIGSGVYTWPLPAGFVADLTKQNNTTPSIAGGDGGSYNLSSPIGIGMVTQQNSVGYFDGTSGSIASDPRVYLASTTSVAIIAASRTNQTRGFAFGSASDFINQFGNNVYIQYRYTVPIVGMSSNNLTSNDASTRVVAMTVKGIPSGSINGSDNVVVYPTVLFDTHAAYSTSTGIYTIPVSGYYNIWGMISFTFTQTLGVSWNLSINQNGTNIITHYEIFSNASINSGSPRVAGVLKCVAGDTIKVNINTNASSTAYGNQPYEHSFSIQQVQGPSAITSNADVNGFWTQTSAQSIPSSSHTIITGLVLSYDSHNGMNLTTGIYTVPISGVYRVSGSVGFDANLGSGAYIGTAIAKNSSLLYSTGYFWNGAAYGRPAGSGTVRCVAGDTIAWMGYQETGTPKSTNASALFNWISIERIGN